MMEVARYQARLQVAVPRAGGVPAVRLTSVSRSNPTYIWGEAMAHDSSLTLAHGDVFTISGRSFRVDYRPAARARLASQPAEEAGDDVRGCWRRGLARARDRQVRVPTPLSSSPPAFALTARAGANAWRRGHARSQGSRRRRHRQALAAAPPARRYARAPRRRAGDSGCAGVGTGASGPGAGANACVAGADACAAGSSRYV